MILIGSKFYGTSEMRYYIKTFRRYISVCQVLYDTDLERRTICPKEKVSDI